MIKQIIVQCFKKLGTDKHIVMLSFKNRFRILYKINDFV